MKYMKYILFSFCMLVFLNTPVLAANSVDNLRLFWHNGEIVLQTNVTGPFQFSHQIAKANDGKPFRVLIDIFPSVHNLGQKSFVNLPSSVIKSIRTSQYAVNPEKIVRIVCDLSKESVYRIEKRDGSVFLFIPDKSNSGFPAWASNDNRKIETVKATPDKPVELKETKPLVMVPSSIMTPEMKMESIPVSDKGVQPESTYYKAQKSGMMEKEWAQSVPSRSPVKSKQEKKPVVERPSVSTKYADTDTKIVKSKKKSVPKAPNKTTKPSVQITQEKFKVPSQPLVLIEPINIADDKKDIEIVSAPKKEIASKTDKEKPVVKKKTPAMTEKSSKPKIEKKTTVKVAVKSPALEEEKAKKPTSRFRRQPSLPARLKGTIVAEFPKRMVIKYKPTLSRDPFASLIGEKKSGDGFNEKKLLDIETAQLVGILESTSGKNRALVEDLDGYGYILKQGDKIKKGYVSKIYSDKALFQLFEYGWSRAHALHLDNE
jgi:hypothetical protein